MTIIAGTTPTIEYTFDTVTVANITTAVFTIKQNGQPVIEKTLEDVTSITSETVTVQLTQDDTLKLNSALNVDIQIRAGFGGDGGSRVRSNIVTASVEKILKDGAI